MREIRNTHSFDEAVENLGGHRLVDEAMEAVIEALGRDPYQFHLIENDWIRARYVITKRRRHIPPLVVLFAIEDNGDVTLLHIEECLEY